MTWVDLGYAVALTVTVGTVLAALLEWRDARAHRAARAQVRRLEPRRPRRRSAEDLRRRIDRQAA